MAPPVAERTAAAPRIELSERDELVRTHMAFASRLAARYRNSSESREDLEQVAYLGLIKAVDRYDPERGPFMRYAVPNILGELRRHFRDKGWGTHVPRSLQERVLKVNEATEVLSGNLGRSPRPKDIAAHTGFTEEEVLEALEAAHAYSPTALDSPFSTEPDGARTLGDTLGSVDPGYEAVDMNAAVAPAFAALPERERLILKLRFIDDLTQSEIAAEVGVSQMHVSRLLRRSLERLKVAAEAAA
jgi:RNA polymerase sigma-B factor